MADSLRDQLIAAGYEAPKKEEKRKPRPHDPRKSQHKGKKSGDKNKARQKPHSPTPGKHTAKHTARPHSNKGSVKGGNAAQSAQAQEAIEERKKLKAQIKTLIDENRLENWKGEVVYRYLVEKRIRELYVSEEIQKQLAERSVAVTRLNGDTYLVPIAIAVKIKEINPQWSVFNTDADAEDNVELKTSDPGSDYADYKVPDDLKW